MLRSAHLLLSPRHPKSRLLDHLPLCRRRYIDAGALASISILSSWHLSSDLVPISQKRFFGLHSASLPPTMNSSNEDSPRNKLMEDLLYVSDLDFREETPCSEPCAGYEPSQHLVEALAGISEDEDAAFVPFESEEAIGGLQKRVLPEELAKAVMHLECESSVEGGHCDVYLVGTAHVSQDSCTEVQAVIRFLKPQAVFLELCSSRITILTPQNLKVPTVHEMIDMWKKKKMNTFGILYSWFLAKVAEKLEVFPGAEFRVAFEEATSYGARVILGDRPVNVTLRRTWGKMSVWHRAKFLYYILFQAFFLPSPEDLNKMLKDMDDVDMLTLVIQEMSKAFPTIMETVLHERDMYMSSTLLKVASEHSSIVAIVGKGHLPGIKRNWKQPVDLKQLMQAPSRRTASMSRTKLFTTISVGVAGVVLASGIYLFVKR